MVQLRFLVFLSLFFASVVFANPENPSSETESLLSSEAETETHSHLDRLSPEILAYCFTFLPLEDYPNIVRINRCCKSVAETGFVFRELLKKHQISVPSESAAVAIRHLIFDPEKVIDLQKDLPEFYHALTVQTQPEPSCIPILNCSCLRAGPPRKNKKLLFTKQSLLKNNLTTETLTSLFRKRKTTPLNLVFLLCKDALALFPDGGQKILMNLLQEDLFKEAQFLIQHGADFQSPNFNNRTPLIQMIQDCNLRGAELLLQQEADPNKKDLTLQMNPIAWACLKDEADEALCFVKLLISFKADLNLPSPQNPLHLATEDWQSDTMMALLKAGAQVDPVDDRGETPLKVALMRKFIKGVEILLAWNANPLLTLQGGRSVFSKMLKRYQVVEFQQTLYLLLHHGLNINHQVDQGNTILHLAVHRKRSDIVPFLISLGANKNIQNSNGETPLQMAIRMRIPNQDPIIRLLSH